MADPVAWYDANAETAVAQYERLTADTVHGWLRNLLPKGSATVLDVGAGSGRDAAWLSAKGYDVVAIEPSASMRDAGAALHAQAPIRWIDDRLPALSAVSKSGLSFDLILLSAVWMHLPPGDRPRAFRKIINLLKPGGLLAIAMRGGPADQARGMHPVSLEEVEGLARDHGAFVERHTEADDHLGRHSIRWIQVAVRLPDDGTGALPLLRHVILNEDKSSTYKLALLRTLCRLADGAAGCARDHDDKFVAVPLGLVALTWIRLFKPLLSKNLPQNPSNIGLRRLGFVKDAYRRLADVSHLDLRVGVRFSGETAAALHQALKDARNNIARMPATYISYPNGEPVFPVQKPGRVPRRPSTITLNHAYLFQFGEMLIPRHLWRALRRFGAWVEPALVSEWSRLIKSYASRQDVRVDDATIAASMTWDEPTRDVGLARERALDMLADGRLHCVWSGRKLNRRSLDIDHCFPWAAWTCGDLWNLMPAHRTVNQHEKRALLPTDRLLQSAQDRVLGWWESAYVKDLPTVSERFWLEATSSLPTVNADKQRLNDVFDAVCFQRIRLKHDQQVPEWTGERHIQID